MKLSNTYQFFSFQRPFIIPTLEWDHISPKTNHCGFTPPPLTLTRLRMTITLGIDRGKTTTIWYGGPRIRTRNLMFLKHTLYHWARPPTYHDTSNPLVTLVAHDRDPSNAFGGCSSRTATSMFDSHNLYPKGDKWTLSCETWFPEQFDFSWINVVMFHKDMVMHEHAHLCCCIHVVSQHGSMTYGHPLVSYPPQDIGPYQLGSWHTFG